MRKTLLVFLFLLPVTSFAQIENIPLFIAETAKAYNVDVKQALYISYMESHWNTEAVGDHGTSFGVWQIHEPEKKGLTIAQAHDLIFSTGWAMKTMFLDGSCRQWSTCPTPSG